MSTAAVTPRRAFTMAALDKIKPGPARQELPDAILPGLYFIVQPTGARSWAIRYRHDGKPRKHTLGSFPKLKLAEARTAGTLALRQVAEGKDPAGEKAEAKRLTVTGLDKADLVSKVWQDYLDQHLSTRRASTKAAAEASFRKWVAPKIGKYKIEEVKKRDVLAVLDSCVKAGYPLQAYRMRAVMTAFFNWTVSRDILQVSPCHGIKAPTTPTARDRALTDDELRWLWKATEKEIWPFGYMVRLLLLTGGRRNEVAGMKDKEVKADLWTLPADRSKNKRPHDVHLTKLSLATIEAMPRVVNDDGLLFCTNGETQVSGFSRAKRRIDSEMLRLARAEAKSRGDDPEKVEIPDWTVHDLRRTVASGMARLGIQLPVVERCLNHISGSFGGIVGVYQRHSFADEKKAAFEAWSRHVESLIDPKKANVVQIGKRKRQNV